MTQAPGKSPHFFEREEDSSVRLRLRFPPELADLVEEAAGTTPLVSWIQTAVKKQAEHDVRRIRRRRPRLRPQ